MARSVVLAGTPRCDGCRLPPRWCVCGALPPVETAVRIDVLIHRSEQWRPSSTGGLLTRAVAGARCHVYQREDRFHAGVFQPEAIPLPGHDVWILHPRGEELPACGATLPPQVLLLDGNWRQANGMLRVVERIGRCVRLPAGVASRFWLRDQHTAGHLSTAEALLRIFHALGDTRAEEALRLHFELHVYATLRARGQRQLADDYLRDSPIGAAIPEVLDRLTAAAR
ncbi:MAG: DTW domain-containing protein [Planctomycetia bacterium]|nr:DTW domain-containing protein [Planctomycetia bacterium]